MNKLNRHHLRLDEATQAALEEICRQICSTKSNVMRQYVMEGVERDIQKIAKEKRELAKTTDYVRGEP